MSCEKPLSFEELRELRSRDLLSYRASEEIQRQEKKLEGYRWFAKAWKRAAKELKRKHSNQSSTIGALLKKRERFHAALTQCFLFVPNAHQTNVYIDEPELLVKDVRALKAKIEALLCEFENAAAMSTQKRTAEWFLRRAREHFGEGK